MTLIIAGANTRHAILVSDRRLSYDGQIVDDEQSKLGVMVTDDACLAFGHTGLARSHGFDAHPWLLETLADAAQHHDGASALVNSMAECATARFRKIRLTRDVDKRFSVLFAGYLYTDDPPRMALALVSNFERLNEMLPTPADEFMTSFIQDRRPPLRSVEETSVILVGGRQDLVRPAELQQLLRLLEQRRPPQGLVGKTLSIIRAVAERDEDHSVGKDCLSVTLNRDSPLGGGPELAVPGEYHPAGLTAKWFGASFVDCRSDGLGIAIMYPTIQEVAGNARSSGFVPKVGRNERCPCGSGRKYKRCHGA
jgi:SEC-C motif